MIGANEIRLNHATIIDMIQHYFGWTLHSCDELKVTAITVDTDKTHHGERYTLIVEVMGKDLSKPKAKEEVPSV